MRRIIQKFSNITVELLGMLYSVPLLPAGLIKGAKVIIRRETYKFRMNRLYEYVKDTWLNRPEVVSVNNCHLVTFSFAISEKYSTFTGVSRI